MSALAPSFAKLLVADVPRSLALYEALGFEVAERDPVFTRLRLPNGADLFLVRLPAGRALEGKRGVGTLVCFRVDRDVDGGVDALAERARAAGAPVDGPTDQPWHTREIVVTDPDGYRVNFVQSAWPTE
jgi:catechol 2,3-dioxygenase-like lactoylglutathione lyase family enzyme